MYPNVGKMPTGMTWIIDATHAIAETGLALPGITHKRNVQEPALHVLSWSL